jgi:hypothetical protein
MRVHHVLKLPYTYDLTFFVMTFEYVIQTNSRLETKVIAWKFFKNSNISLKGIPAPNLTYSR